MNTLQNQEAELNFMARRLGASPPLPKVYTPEYKEYCICVGEYYVEHLHMCIQLLLHMSMCKYLCSHVATPTDTLTNCFRQYFRLSDS